MRKVALAITVIIATYLSIQYPEAPDMELLHHGCSKLEAAKLAAEHAGKIGLWNVEQRCCFDLSQPLLFQDFTDFADELSFDEQAAGRRAAEIGVDVAATRLHFNWDSRDSRVIREGFKSARSIVPLLFLVVGNHMATAHRARRTEK